MMIIYGILAAVVAVIFSIQMLPPTLDLRPATASTNPDETMAAIVYHEHGDVSVLRYEESHPKPVPRQNQYLIQVKASALNPVDFKMRRNVQIPQFLLPLPKIPGSDVSGIVVQAPSNTSKGSSNTNKFRVGDRVAAMMPVLSRWGSHADYVAVDERFMAKLGDHTDFESAAAYPLAALTVLQNFQALTRDTDDDPANNNSNNPPKKLLVHAGAGGVGSFAIQWGKLLGMYVATTASAPKADVLKELGADLVIDYYAQKFEQVCTNYDVVLDPMSWLYEDRTFEANVLKPTGHYLNIPSSDWGLKDGMEITNGVSTVKNYIISKLMNLVKPELILKYTLISVSPSGEDVQQVMNLVDSGKDRALIDRKFYLSDAMEAYKYLEAGHATGKVVLQHGSREEGNDTRDGDGSSAVRTPDE